MIQNNLWETVLEELERATPSKPPHWSDAAADSLHGSMWGLNHRYETTEYCLQHDWDSMLGYTITRIKKLLGSPVVEHKIVAVPRALVGFGTYGWKYDHRLIQAAVSRGVGLIDSAEGYGYGRVEKELGMALHGIPFDGVATKVSRSHMSPKAIEAAAIRSKGTIKRTYHYQIHYPHNAYSDEVLGKTFVRLRRYGVIKSIGLGNCSVDMIESMQRFLSDYSGDVIRSVQVCYSLINRRIESFLLPYCQQMGILVIAYSPLGQHFKELNSPVLQDMALRNNCTAPQVALAWLLQKNGVCPIPRTNDMNHLCENIDANNLELCPDDIRELNNFYR